MDKGHVLQIIHIRVMQRVSRDMKSLQYAVIKFSLFQKSVHPTTGILAVFVALNYCDVVHIAGFGYPNSRTIGQPIHYYGNDTMKSMKVSRGHGPCKVQLFDFTIRIIAQ